VSDLPIPIGSGEARLFQAGRIRIGIKDKSRQGRRAINTFRLTSQERSFLDAVAKVYGGEVTTFSDPKSGDCWEVITKTKRMSVVLPATPSPLTQGYEKWSGQTGLERRCDTVTCSLAVSGPEGGDRQDVPCICLAQGVRECKYILRLNVILPETETIGTWRLDTSSKHARAEIPSVVKLITAAQGAGLYTAVLRLEQRTSPGHRFNVPVLDPGVGIETLMAGGTRVAALPESGRPPAIGQGHPEDRDSLVIEGEIVEDEHMTLDPITGPQPIDPDICRAYIASLTGHQRNRALKRARTLALELGEPVPANAESISVPVIDKLMQEESWD
jgi:hypothetical protein